MLRRVAELRGYSLRARDGDVGTVEDVFFSDEDWTVRYFVVDTGPWLRSRRVLISPLSLTEVSEEKKSIAARLTREQVQASPHVDTAQPISRQYEIEFSRHYALPRYWAGGGIWGSTPPPPDQAPPVGPSPPREPMGPAEPSEPDGTAETKAPSDTVRLRSCHEIRGYRFEGQDGELGHIKDCVLDDKDWLIRYVEIDTRKWWPGGKKVLLARQWIDEVSWTERKVKAEVHRDTVKKAPPYDESSLITPDYELELFKHYGREIGS